MQQCIGQRTTDSKMASASFSLLIAARYSPMHEYVRARRLWFIATLSELAPKNLEIYELIINKLVCVVAGVVDELVETHLTLSWRALLRNSSESLNSMTACKMRPMLL